MTGVLPELLRRKLLFILHHGLVEIRNLAVAAGQDQIAELADALEIIPGLIEGWDNDRAETVRDVLKDYRQQVRGKSVQLSGPFREDRSAGPVLRTGSTRS
jgi:hypothetical protein